MSEVLARGYLPGVTSFQNLDGLLDSFNFFVSQNYQNYLVVWYRLTSELESQGPLKVYDQSGVQTEFGQHILVPSSQHSRRDLERVCDRRVQRPPSLQK